MLIAVAGFPSYSAAERWADGVVHIAGTSLAVVGVVWLANQISASVDPLSMFVYFAGLLAMLAASAAYNFATPGPAKEIFRRIDHAAIFVMIAGTGTPFAANRFDGTLASVLIPAMWLCAACGVILKVCYPRALESATVALYLAFGWAAIALIEPLSRAISTLSLILLVAGGVFYSIGAGFHLLKRLPFHNAIWHGFVLAAAALHFGSIATEFGR